jgi:hypothetical protein
LGDAGRLALHSVPANILSMKITITHPYSIIEDIF